MVSYEKVADEHLIVEADRLYSEDSLLAATKLLLQVVDKKLLTPQHEQVIHMGTLIEHAREEMLASPEKSGWKKQSESHGHRDYLVYYKILESGAVECRIDSPIEASLYVPFLSVFNEPDLYHTWLPSWKFPFRVGVSSSVKLAQRGRVHQIVRIVNDFPWPLVQRELILKGFADDDSARSRIACVKLMSLQSSDEDECVPPIGPKTVRMELDGGLLFRPCPPDHPALSQSKAHYPTGEKLVLITFTMMCDTKLDFIPRKFLNFCTRTVMGSVWRMMLNVAEEVRDGKRPEFTEIMEKRRGELYEWMEERANLVANGPTETETKS